MLLFRYPTLGFTFSIFLKDHLASKRQLTNDLHLSEPFNANLPINP